MNEKQIRILALSGVGVVIVAVLLFSSIYIVAPTEQVVLTQFGKPVDVVKDEGLHFKIPFIQNPFVSFLTVRLSDRFWWYTEC